MQVDVPTKSALSSATVWLNVLTILIVALGAVVDNAAGLNMPPEILAYVVVALGIANTLLRVFKTSQPIGDDGGVKTITVDPPNLGGPHA